jgi:hypothetical protein
MSQYNPNYKSLENNIMDIIIEQQIKLGYREETLRLYYPMESINRLLEVELPIHELEIALDGFCQFVSEQLGNVKYSRSDQRFCILIPPKGVTYVYHNADNKSFLKELIDIVTGHQCSIEDILAIFNRYSNHVICNKLFNGEFDYLIYFEDGIPDAYRYCIKFEECHVIYHRFTKADYEALGVEN